MNTLIAGYRVIAKINESTNALIYRGYREEDKLPVILKILKESYPTLESLAQFQQEYEILCQLNLPGVVKTYGLERYQNSIALIIEDFGAQSLQSLMAQGRLTLREFLNLGVIITENLGMIHQQQIIHKDINPSNIVLNLGTKQIKFIDFGIATVQNPIIRNPNIIEGTLAYISPEQTGRMNRGIDYRSDFYSLGVTFYEMLTNQLPFVTHSAIELVHCHLAKYPIPPHELKGDIPQAVSEIVGKLMAKTAEERYQSTDGIKADLERCWQQLQQYNQIEVFPLGEQDIANKFQIPQKLYGREEEIATLLSAFERVMGGKSEMMLISGYSGTGKSALVREIYQPITQQKSYFISGKFDQFQQNIPYSSLIQAFQELTRQLLSESDTQIAQWKAKLLSALGVNGQIILDVIPEVELIIGKQVAVPKLPPTETQNRFNLVLQNFIKVFTKLEHPLVIFLDDLQWSDNASLRLIQKLITAIDNQYLLLICAYRDNEVSVAHPLMLTLDKIRSQGIVINQIFLTSLDLQQINQLIRETLKCQEGKTQGLAKLVQEKTDGNPFFLKEFLESLFSKKLLKFDSQKHIWQWNIEQIEEAQITDNVVELMAGKIQDMQEQTQEVLKLAACIGNQFDLNTLSVVYKKSPTKTANALWEALQLGLVLPLNKDYRLLKANNNQGISKSLMITYKFLHDRVQQAAYSLILPQQKPAVHLIIGQLLLKNTPANKQEDKLFDIVNQLNFGRVLINSQIERYQLAKLNLLAGKKAKSSIAYKPAWDYFQVGIKLLETEESWKKQYELALELFIEAAETAYLEGKFEEMEELIGVILQEANSTLDKVKAYEVKILACVSQNKLLESVQIALPVLQLLGVNLSDSPNMSAIQQGLEETTSLLQGKPIRELINLPEISNPIALAAIRIMASITSPTYLAIPQLFPLTVIKQVNLSIQYGNAPESAFAYAAYGLILCGLLKDIDCGYEFGNLALEVIEKFDAKRLKARTFFVVYWFIKHWKKSSRQLLPNFLIGYQVGLETGDHEYAAWNSHAYCLDLFFIGNKLNELEPELQVNREAVNKLNKTATLDQINMNIQVVLNLTNKTQDYCYLRGEVYNEEEKLPIHIQSNHQTAIFHLYFYKVMLSYLFGDFAQAVENAAKATQYLDAVCAIVFVPIFHLYHSLALLAIYPQAENTQQKYILEQVIANQENMKIWARHAPSNYQNKYYLVEAEYAKILNNNETARKYYDQAITLAQENQYLNEEALAYELAARFHLSRNHKHLARYYLQDAHYTYQLWGAIAKVKDLEKQYPQFFAQATEGYPQTLPISSKTTTEKHLSSALDLTSILKASQTISGEIVPEKMRSKLMKTVIENAGAQKGFLISDKNGQWVIEAEGNVHSDDVTILQSINRNTPSKQQQYLFPDTIINYVVHSKENVVLNNATEEGQFTQDVYIIANQSKSILCMPLLYQGKLNGILYLENNLTTGTFTPERFETLRILAAQAAISLENSRLYEQLEDYSRNLAIKVEIRTQELQAKNKELGVTLEKLKATQARIIVQEKLASLGALTAGIAHEIKNPLNFVNNFAELSVELTEELLEIIEQQKDYLNPEIQDDIAEILQNLQQNTQKINEHGKRADRIVQGMLMHSRGQSGERQLTDINALLGEAISLAYHGMRAKVPGFNITIETDYDTQLKPLSIVPQNISRVFLNIINNACYSVHEKQKMIGDSFSPLLSISTKDGKKHIEISIRDNGKGIPQDIVDKIFNPFFSTKPTGQGTGLGLSISHDIIVQEHQGKISVKTEVNDYTELIIILPKIPVIS